MRPRQRRLPDDALSTFDTFLQQTQEARGLRRTQAVRAVVKGQRLPTIADPWSLTYAALRKGGPRVAPQGTPGLMDHPRPGRPPQGTCALAQHLPRLVAQDPLAHGSRSSPWRCRALAPVFARETGGQLGRASVRGVLKKAETLLASPRAPGSHPCGPRLGGSCTGRPRGPGAPWGSGLGAVQ